MFQVPPALSIDQPEVEQRRGIVGLDFQGLHQRGQGPAGIARAMFRDGNGGQNGCRARGALECAVQRGAGIGPSPAVQVEKAQSFEGTRVVGSEPGRFLEELCAAVFVAGLLAHHSQITDRFQECGVGLPAVLERGGGGLILMKQPANDAQKVVGRRAGRLLGPAADGGLQDGASASQVAALELAFGRAHIALVTLSSAAGRGQQQRQGGQGDTWFHHARVARRPEPA